MKIHEMKLSDLPFQATCSGKKTIEIRLNDDRRASLNIGDLILFQNDRLGTIKTRIISIKKYKCMSDLISAEDFLKTGGIYQNTDSWIEAINTYYSISNQNKHGLLSIEIALI